MKRERFAVERTRLFEMGLLEGEGLESGLDWPGDDFTGDKSAAPAIVGRFTVKARDRVKRRGALYQRPGAFTAGVNGKPLSENLFEPGE